MSNTSLGDSSAVWCFAADDDEEVWQYGGATREAAIAAGYLELSKWTDEPEDRADFCVAPTHPATQQDVDEYTGDEVIEVGWPMVDIDRIEYIPYPRPADTADASGDGSRDLTIATQDEQADDNPLKRGDLPMSTMLEAEVTAARNHTLWTGIRLAEMMKDLASEGAEVSLTCDARPDVASRFWWTLRWTTADGRRWTADAQTLDLCCWRAAVREQKTRGMLDSLNTASPDFP